MAGRAKWAGFTDEQARQLEALVSRLTASIDALKAPDRVLDRRGSAAAVRVRPGDVVRAEAGDVIVLPHPRSAKGRHPVVVLIEGTPVTLLSESGTVNNVDEVTVTTVGAMEWWSTGTEWWGTAVGGSSGGGGVSLTYGSPVDVGLANADGVSTAVARADHVHRDRIATGTEDGFLTRIALVHASSPRLGNDYFGTELTAGPLTWTDETDVPDGELFQVIYIGAGGGGSAGNGRQSGQSTSAGSGGGGGANPPPVLLSRSDILSLLPLTFTPGLGGAGGNGNTGGSGVDALGGPGGNGEASTFGSWIAGGGGGGNGKATANNGGTKAGGGGGGAAGSGEGGFVTDLATGNDGGYPRASTSHNEGLGGGGSPNSSSAPGSAAVYGGGGGAPYPGSTVGPRAGGTSWRGGGGGGNGGGVVTIAFAGGAGGKSGEPLSGDSGGGGAGGAAAAAGTDGADGVAIGKCGAGGGGGGGTLATTPVTGASGGDGGFPGGGGGGSGAAVVTPGAGTKTTLDGGRGGDGLIVITVW